MIKNFGLIGKKLSHSFSKKYFSEKFLKLGLNYSYELIEIEHIEEILPCLENPNFIGFNVTIPYKTEILNLVQSSEEVQKIGAANVLYKSDNQWLAKNTDVIGFQMSLKNWLNENQTKALILGDGGASKAVQFALNQLEIPFDICGRNKKNKIQYHDIQDFKPWNLIIQTTPVGMFPNENDCLDLPYSTLTEKHYCYDLIYNPLETKFLNKAKVFGAKIKNGLEMLELQAEAAWEIWNK